MKHNFDSLTAECVAAGTDWPTQAELNAIEQQLNIEIERYFMFQPPNAERKA